MAEALTAAGANLRNVQLLGTGLWDDPRVFADRRAAGRAGTPRPTRRASAAFADRYRTKYGADPVRTATLAYDAVALVAALARTQGPQRFSQRDADQRVGLCRHRRAVPFQRPTAPTSAGWR